MVESILSGRLDTANMSLKKGRKKERKRERERERSLYGGQMAPLLIKNCGDSGSTKGTSNWTSDISAGMPTLNIGGADVIA